MLYLNEFEFWPQLRNSDSVIKLAENIDLVTLLLFVTNSI